MIELFWIKSLVSFLAACLCLLVLAMISSYRSDSLVRLWSMLLWIWGGIYLCSFLRFTTWINESSTFISVLHDMSLSLRFLLGPLFLFAFDRIKTKSGLFIHLVPFVLALVFTVMYEVGSTFMLFAQAHSIMYFLILRRTKKDDLLSEEGIGLVDFILTLWVISSVVQSIELILWGQFNLIGEGTAWILYIASNALVCSSFIYLAFKIGSRNFEFEKKDQPKLPSSVEAHLGQNLLAYLSDPQVYSDPLIDIKGVARNLRVSPHHISHFLNHHHGERFISIINRQRISDVIEKLKDANYSQMSIQEIYYSVGFNTKSTFITAFKKKTGVTPSVYRRDFGIKNAQGQVHESCKT